MQPSIGARIGRYELLQRLGAGAMGEVYRARDHELGRDIAIKFLPERFSSDPDRMARFANEARAASSLNHPNIVTIHEVGRADTTPFLVMEYVEGQTVRQLLEGPALPPKRILDLAVQIGDGLAKAHAAGIVHRDLKPENLMVTPDGFVKILDFGLAKLYQSDASVQSPVASQLPTLLPGTPLGSASGIVGTLGYMSPEQAAGRSVDFRSDQFSFGAILYELVTGRRAFQAATPLQTLAAAIHADPEPLSSHNPSFPAPARWIVDRCLAKDPNGRYSSTADLARELHGVRDHLAEISAADAKPPHRAAGRLARLGRSAAVGLAIALGLLAVEPVREAILRPLHMLPLPSEKRIAVLPFRYAGTNEDDRRLCDGMLPYLTARLGQLERFQKKAWVVPAQEVHEAGVVGAKNARRALGATLAVEGDLQRVQGRLVLSVSITDTESLRQLRAAAVEFTTGETLLLDAAVSSVVSMLDLELGPEERTALHLGGTSVVEASTAYGRALGYTPYQQARTALERYEQEQNLERAISLFNEALRRDPHYALAHAGLGEAYWRLSRFTRKAEHVSLAEEQCRRALALDSTVAEAWITLGILHTGTGKPEEALQDLQRAIDRDPRNAVCYREQANAYRRLTQDADADATYRKAIALQPDSWVSRSYYGNYLATRGRAAEAEQQYREALKLVPDNARLWSGLGSAYYLQEKYAQAEEAWRKSLQLHPTSTAASNLALRPFYQGQYPEAALRLELALKMDDRDYRVWRNLASAYYWSPGGRPRANVAYRRAAMLAERERALDPADPRLLADLADCYAMLSEPEKARRAASEAARLGGKQGEIARTIAAVYEQLGDRHIALKWVSTAVKLGVPPDEIERDPGLEKLRQDPGYLKVVRNAKPNPK